MDTLYSIFPAHRSWPPAVDDVLKSPPDKLNLRLTSGARNLGMISSYRNLKALWCFDISEEKLEFISSCASLESLYIRNLKTQNVGLLRNLNNLKILGIDTCSKVNSLDAFTELQALSGLAITHFKNVHDLGPLAELKSLRALAVGGGMWTRMKVESFKPLAGLVNLELLSLTNIKAMDESLKPLGSLKKLKTLDIAKFYPMSEFAWLSQQLKTAECQWFKPYVELSYMNCEKCARTSMVMLNGKRKSVLCRLCDIRAFENHVQYWAELVQKRD